MSITAPLLGDNLTALPPEVVKALKIKPSSTLIYEIEHDGRVVLSAKSIKPPKPRSEGGGGKITKSAELAGTFPKTSLKEEAGRRNQLLELAGTFPGLKPGVKPATIEELNEIISQRAVARYERSLK